MAWTRRDIGRHYPGRPVPAWPAPPEAEAQEREELGRCPSCAKRDHDCQGGECNCPRVGCVQARLEAAPLEHADPPPARDSRPQRRVWPV